MQSSKSSSLFTNVLTCAVLAGTLATAAVEAKGFGSRGAQFDRIDSNGDAVLTVDELLTPALSRVERGFDRRDSDGDGLLSFDEATGGREGHDFSDIAEDIVQCVADMAATDDSIQVPEADRFMSPEDRFNNRDTSGDGVLDLTEVEAGVTEKVSDRFDMMDADDDSQVTEDEFTAAKETGRATRRAVRTCIRELTEE